MEGADAESTAAAQEEPGMENSDQEGSNPEIDGTEEPDDEDLVEEIIGLVEWPVVFLGYIDEEFLSLPKEILQVTMKEHQKLLSVINKKTEIIDKTKPF